MCCEARKTVPKQGESPQPKPGDPTGTWAPPAGSKQPDLGYSGSLQVGACAGPPRTARP